jgi:hypothetical protein
MKKEVKNPMYLSLVQAAKESGKSKSVIHNALKNGRLSGAKNDKGNWQIDPAELFRVFPKGVPKRSGGKKRTVQNPTEHVLLEQEVEHLRERLADKDMQVADLRRRLDASEDDRRQAQDRLTALLEDKRERKPAARPKRRGLFSLFSGDE